MTHDVRRPAIAARTAPLRRLAITVPIAWNPAPSSQRLAGPGAAVRGPDGSYSTPDGRMMNEPGISEPGGGQAPPANRPPSNSPPANRPPASTTPQPTNTNGNKPPSTGTPGGSTPVGQSPGAPPSNSPPIGPDGKPNYNRSGGKFYTQQTERVGGNDLVGNPGNTQQNLASYLRQSGAAETAALQKLPPSQKATYDRLFKSLQGRILDQATLRKLLLDGCATELVRGGDKAALLDQLDRLSTQAVAPGMNRATLLSETFREVQDPTSITQGGKGTCAATAAQILLAKTDPAEYARLVSGLASPEGTVMTARGDTLARETDWNAADGGRSTASRLLQPAFMEYANSMFADYDNSTDEHSNGRVGLDVWESERLLDAITGQDYSAVNVEQEAKGSSKLEDAFIKTKAAANSGKPVPVGLFWGETGHKVLVMKVEAGRVHYINAQGAEASLVEDEFKARLKNLNLPSANAPTVNPPPTVLDRQAPILQLHIPQLTIQPASGKLHSVKPAPAKANTLPAPKFLRGRAQ